MLVDEEGLLKPNKLNRIGSYLYKTDEHGCPIAGNILFVGETWGGDASTSAESKRMRSGSCTEKLQKMALALQPTEGVAKS